MNRHFENFILKEVAQALGLACAFSIMFTGCHRSTTQTTNQAIPEQLTAIQKTERLLQVREPFDENHEATFGTDFQSMKKAWEKFMKTGHYRLAQAEDFRFSEVAKKNMRLGTWERYVTQPYIWWWGAFAAIVVDTSRMDDKRFGLVIFPTSRGTDAYKPVWLYKNKDLSATGLDRASGYWFVTEYSKDGIEKVCEIDPDKKSKGYICH